MLNLNRILKEQFKKIRLISGSTINSELSNHTTFRQLKSRVPAPLKSGMMLNVQEQVTAVYSMHLLKHPDKKVIQNPKCIAFSHAYIK